MPGSQIRQYQNIPRQRENEYENRNSSCRAVVHRGPPVLSAKKRQFLQVAAVLGPTFALSELAELLHKPVASLLPTIEWLLAENVITSGDKTFAFSDHQVWQELVSAIPRPALQTLREEAAAMRSGALRVSNSERLIAVPEIAERRTVASTVMLSNLRWNQGSPTEALELAREAVGAIGEHTPLSSMLLARLALACKLLCLRELEEAAVLIDAARRDVGEQELPEQVAALQVIWALSHAQQGRLKEASTEAVLVLRNSPNAARRDYEQVARAVLALAALRGGDRLAAAAQVRRFRTQIPQDSLFPSMYLDWVAFLVASDQREPADALDIAASSFPALLERRVLWYTEPAAAPWLIRLALDSGDRRFAAKIADRVSLMVVEMPGVPVIADVFAHSQALVEGNLRGLEKAAITHRDPWCAGLAAEDLAMRQIEQGEETSRIGQWLESALGRFTALGMSRDIERVREHLKRLGASQAAGDTGTAGRWEDLTQAERRIARLVCQGLNNRQIAESIHISPHTVNYHLRRIFRKLGINSRVGLARITPFAE